MVATARRRLRPSRSRSAVAVACGGGAAAWPVLTAAERGQDARTRGRRAGRSGSAMPSARRRRRRSAGAATPPVGVTSPADVASSARGVPSAGAAAQLSAEPTGTAAEIEGWGAGAAGAGAAGAGVGAGAAATGAAGAGAASERAGPDRRAASRRRSSSPAPSSAERPSSARPAAAPASPGPRGPARPRTRSAPRPPWPSPARRSRRTRPGTSGRSAVTAGGGSVMCAYIFATSVGAVERDRAGQHLVEHRAERVDVGAGARRLAADLLGRGVVDAAHEQAGLGHPARAGVPREPEVGQVDVILGRDQHVGGLDVAVHEAARVGGVERGGDLADDPHRPVRRQLALVVEQVGQIATLDPPHRDEQVVVGLTRLVERDDVRMVDRGGDLPLALEALAEGDVGRVRGGDELQRDRPAQRELGGAEHDAHAAAAGDLVDPVSGELRTWGECGGGGGDTRNDAGTVGGYSTPEFGCVRARGSPRAPTARDRRSRASP